MTGFDPEVWARRQPHNFYSHWPLATMTKCDYCGVRAGEHAPDVPDEANVARHATAAIAGGLDPAAWPRLVVARCGDHFIHDAHRTGATWCAGNREPIEGKTK